MKNFVSVAALFVVISSSVHAVAEPAARVGDQAVYAGTMTIGQNSYPASLSLEVTGPGSKPGTFVVTQVISVAGQSQTSTSERTPEEIGDEALAADFVANCAANKGVPEQIVLSSGEKLDTCKVTGTQNGSVFAIHLAAVPFLIARRVTSQSSQISTFELQSYRRGL